jgi:hypothetical protein
MKNAITISLTVFFMATCASQMQHAQTHLGRPMKVGALDNGRPTVYLEYYRGRDNRERESDESEQLLWLRLKNNSSWGIRLQMSGGRDKKVGDIRLYFDVVDLNGNIIRHSACHVCSSNILGPGKAVVFAIPRASVSSDSSLRLPFSYEWEDFLKVAEGSEPTHYIFFAASDLPKTL